MSHNLVKSRSHFHMSYAKILFLRETLLVLITVSVKCQSRWQDLHHHELYLRKQDLLIEIGPCKVTWKVLKERVGNLERGSTGLDGHIESYQGIWGDKYTQPLKWGNEGKPMDWLTRCCWLVSCGATDKCLMMEWGPQFINKANIGEDKEDLSRGEEE